MGAVVGAPGAAARGQHARERRAAGAGARRAGLLVPRLRPRVQAQVVAAQPPEVGVRQGAAVPVPLLRVPRQAEDAHRAPHGAHAPRGARQARPVHQAEQRRRLHVGTDPLDLVTIEYSIIFIRFLRGRFRCWRYIF